jgi:Methyltransferase domain
MLHMETPQLAEIDLNDLPKWSRWPARLLGIEKFDSVTRDMDRIHSEYSEDKWQKCVNLYEQSGAKVDASELRKRIYDLHSSKRRAAIFDGKICNASNAEVMDWYDKLLTEAIRPSAARIRTIVELGCGIGHMMWMLRANFPQIQYTGGDFADSAVALAARLYSGVDNVRVEKFNFYESEFDLLERAEGPVLVLTSQALEQVPRSRDVINTLAKYRHKIDRVLHMEPGYSLYDDGTLLGQMRTRYIEVNDYNRDLVPTLQSMPDVSILRLEPHAVGWNPFNSLTLIEWKFISIA